MSFPCPKCQALVDEGMRFCPACGQNIGPSKQTTTEKNLQDLENPVGRITCLILSVVILVMVGYCSYSSIYKPVTTTPSDTRVSPTANLGDTVRLSLGSGVSAGQALLLVTEKEDWAELSKILQARDWEGIMEMTAAGKAFSATNGARARVLNVSGIIAVMYKVRVLDGENQGRSGWIPAEFVSE